MNEELDLKAILENASLQNSQAKNEHILSNIKTEDVVAMTDEDNILRIAGDSSDTLVLDSNQWQQVPETNEYINISDGSLAAGTVKLLVEDIDVQF